VHAETTTSAAAAAADRVGKSATEQVIL